MQIATWNVKPLMDAKNIKTPERMKASVDYDLLRYNIDITKLLLQTFF
jgi:hypothetical protein